MNPGKNVQAAAGFTLLEVLIALAVFTIAAGGLLYATSEHIKTSSYLEGRLAAVWLAENKLNEARAIGPERIRPGMRSEYYAGREWSVTMRVSRDARLGTSHVGIEVTLKDSDAVRAELDGYL
jgi:general secretion pathway protein I